MRYLRPSTNFCKIALVFSEGRIQVRANRLDAVVICVLIPYTTREDRLFSAYESAYAAGAILFGLKYAQETAEKAITRRLRTERAKTPGGRCENAKICLSALRKNRLRPLFIAMILYLMRHADAGVARGNPLLDAKRGLVKEGKEQCMLMARVLVALKAPIDAIVSSPLKRALQTAQFVGTELDFDGKVEISSALAPGGSFAQFQALLAKHSGREAILAVGHNPNLFQFLGRLITGNGEGASIRMRKASVARVDLDKHPARLQWLMDPRTARSIYASVTKSSRPKTSRK